MRKLASAALGLAALAFTACESSTGPGDNVLRFTGQLNDLGNAQLTLPREAGTVNRLPALTCYVSEFGEDWFVVASVEGTSNCLISQSINDPNRLDAIIEGEAPGWFFQFVVVY